ncbi:unnamed protein product [Schistosoma mattheei]|uniref:Uncharacterized protein n=1 Tax=Schistosoma mattheei TaxID=31246 RepID=A0A183NSY9_9TREM|nr:unnamed protein product [Schistosoma mattheei]
MALPSNQLQLLIQQQQQRFKKNQLEFIDQLHTGLLNYPCFGDLTGFNELISKWRTELGNDCRMYECVDESFYEPLISSIVSKTVAVIHDPLSGRSFQKHDLSWVQIPWSPKHNVTNTDLSSSQSDNVLLNAHETVAVPAHEET